MIRIIRCPDYPLTRFMRSHLESRFRHEFAKYRAHITSLEVSVRSLHQNARTGDDVLVHVKAVLKGMDNTVITAVSHSAHLAINTAARRARREVRREIRRQRQLEKRGLRHHAKLEFPACPGTLERPA
jgi:hypothetical protein